MRQNLQMGEISGNFAYRKFINLLNYRNYG